MKKTILLLIALSAMLLSAAEKNLVLNGKFTLNGKNFPPFWMFRSHTPSTVDCFSEGGPNGLGFLRIHGRKHMIQVIQNNNSLVKDEKYRISAYVRTRNLDGKRNGVAIHPGAVDSELKFPQNQPDWKYIEKIHSAYSTGDKFYFAIEVDAQDGILDIADLKIVPLGKVGIEQSKTQIQNVPKALVPLNLLNYIDISKPELDFMWVGELPGKKENLKCVFSLNGKSLSVPFTTDTFKVNFKKLSPAKGKNNISAEIVDRNGKSLFKQEYQVRFISVPVIKEQPKRLNNMVSVIYEGKIGANKSKSFAISKNSWILFRYTGNETPELTINGKTVLAADFPHKSGVRYLEIGSYELKNNGKECDVSIRIIPDMHMFPLWNIRFSGNGVYDWDFAKKYMLPALTVINIGGIEGNARKEVERFGLKFLSNASAIQFGTPENLANKLTALPENNSDFYDGTTMDEIEYWDCKAPGPYAQGLRLFKNKNNKEIRTWVIGPPTHSYADFISAVSNVSGGRGRLLYEVYNRAQFTEEDAKNYIRQTSQHASQYKDIAPALFNNISVILGNFSAAPLISLDNIPTVDFRYYLDMQMNMLANNPKLDNLSGVGYWGSMNCDEEILRWCFALLKHYCIEGNTSMLSEKYGYTYNLKLLKNPDFEEKLEHWQISGKVEAASKEGFGVKYQKRYGSVYSQGDTFAVLTREAAAPSVVRQKITGLTPGKLYSVYYMTSDYDDVCNDKFDPKRIGLQLTVPGTTIVRRSYYIDERKSSSIKVSMNCCKYVFRAKSSETELVFSNAQAPVGSKQTLNYITVRPYFER